jgi:PAS domain S-box-containing protein
MPDWHFCHELLASLPVAIYTTDAAGRVTFFNEAAADLAGKQPVLGVDRWCVAWPLYWPDGSPMAHDESPMAIALREGRPVRGREAVVERPDGERVAVLPHPTPVFDAAGRLAGAVNMLVDITDRKQGEHALRWRNRMLERHAEDTAQQLEATAAKLQASERDFRLLVDSVTDYAIFMLDPDGYVTSWNAGAERIKGYRANDVIGRHFSTFYPPAEIAAGAPQRALATAAREGRFAVEAKRLRKDGSEFWASVVMDPIRDESGALIGFAKVTRDISEQRRTEQEAAENAALTRGIIETALDAFVQIDQTGLVLEWNAEAADIFGWTREEAVGKPLWEMVLPAAIRARGRHWLDRFLRSGEAGVRGRRLQVRARRRGGAEITVEVSVTALPRGDGWLVNGFVRDLTEKLEADARLRHAEKMEAIGELTGGVAHDFNNLLTAIIGNLEVLAANLGEGGAAGRSVEGALRAAWRGSGLIEQLLAFSRREDGQPEIVDIAALLREVIALCEKTLGEGMEIDVRIAPGLWPSRIDPGQFEAALLNLVANARDAMQRSGRISMIAENKTVPLRQDPELAAGDYVVVAVADTGCGMSREALARACEPFFTTKESGKGTGLGLSQAYGFARQSGGALRIESRPGDGTTVRLYLPRAAGPAREESVPSRLAAAPGGNATVLIVEDDADLREMIGEVLSHLGYRTLGAGSGPEALAILRQEPEIDLLLSDNLMPAGITGVELARTARKLQPGIKVLLSSGYAGDAGALQVGEFSFISKPYRPADLAAKIDEVLTGR